jgi:hypothetical protein
MNGTFFIAGLINGGETYKTVIFTPGWTQSSLHSCFGLRAHCVRKKCSPRFALAFFAAPVRCAHWLAMTVEQERSA